MIIPFHIQVTQLVKHLSVGRQHALSENVGRLLKRGNAGELVSLECTILHKKHTFRLDFIQTQVEIAVLPLSFHTHTTDLLLV